jgi:phage tail tape-measure protein
MSTEPLLQQSKPDSADTRNQNEDPITHEPGAHPVSTGVGAAGGGATGAAIGLAMGGPVGGVIGAVVGALAGGFAGKAVGEAVEPTQENESWPGEAAALRAENARTDARANTDSGAAFTDPAARHEAIALRAWSYYELDGKVDGHDLEHWLRSERELVGE